MSDVRLLEEEVGVEPLADQAALHVGERGDHRVDGPELGVLAQLVKSQHAPILNGPGLDFLRQLKMNTPLALQLQGREVRLSTTAPVPEIHTSEDEKVLHKLGYAQE